MTEAALTTGWEPELDSSDTVLRAQVWNLAARFRFTGERTGSPSLDGDGIVGVLRTDVGPWANDIVVLQPVGMDRQDWLCDRVRSFADRPTMIWSAWPTPDLATAGFSLMGHPPAMLRPPGGDAPPAPDGLRVVEADSDGAMDDYDRACVFGFPINGPDGQPLTGLLDGRIRGGPWRFFVGYADDQPVTCASVFVDAGVAQVEYVATMPEYRGRGYGEAVTWAATLAEPELPAVLLASDAGRLVYERMGYWSMTRFTLWYWKGEPA